MGTILIDALWSTFIIISGFRLKAAKNTLYVRNSSCT